jgi:hypothetical protein
MPCPSLLAALIPLPWGFALVVVYDVEIKTQSD